jgi:RNA polymerase sigma-70 factor (ECF subfamily)
MRSVTLSRFAEVRVSTVMDRSLELELVDRLRSGDPAAFDAVHEAFNARLYNFLVRLANRRDVAEDLLEETWLRLVVHARRLKPDTRLGPWLFTVARNLYASHCRARLLEDSHADGLIGLWPSGTPRPSPLDAAEASETQRRIAAALGSLPARYREVLLLVAVDGLQPSEAAEVCGVTPEAMRQRLSRARDLLARRLRDAEEGGLTALNEVPT